MLIVFSALEVFVMFETLSKIRKLINMTDDIIIVG